MTSVERPMLSDRSNDLLMQVRSRGGATVGELSAGLGISAATVRRELGRLSEAGLLVRTYGGAKPVGLPSAFGMSTGETVEKVRIGRAAAALIEPGDTVALSSGTTTMQVAQHLRGLRPLNVVTNALDIAWLLLDVPGLELIVLGGSARPGMHSLLGHLTETCAAQLRADKLILGIPAFHPANGLTSHHSAEVVTDRSLCGMARQIILVAESRKCGRSEPLFLCPMSDVDVLVTDDGLPVEQRREIERRGVEVLLA